MNYFLWWQQSISFVFFVFLPNLGKLENLKQIISWRGWHIEQYFPSHDFLHSFFCVWGGLLVLFFTIESL